jgi:very-short-patch-repair endonuclease
MRERRVDESLQRIGEDAVGIGGLVNHTPSPSRHFATDPSLYRDGRGVENGEISVERPSPLAGEGVRLSVVSLSGSGRGGLPSQQELLAHAKWMRSNPTEAERKLWSILRNKRFAGCKFKRQVVIDWYIADFVNFEHRVIVEADGCQHAESDYDARRDDYLRAQGFAVTRFWNNDIFLETQSVEDAIWHALQKAPSPSRGRSWGAGEGRVCGRGDSFARHSAKPGIEPASSLPPLPSAALRLPPSPARGEGIADGTSL